MRKNPGRRDRRQLARNNRTKLSGKKMAINERLQLWASKGKHQEEDE